MRRNQQLDAVLFELVQAGLEPEVVINKHVKVKWRTRAGAVRTCVVSSSTSDHRSAANARALVRRMLRQDRAKQVNREIQT